MHGLQEDFDEDGSQLFSIKYENGVYIAQITSEKELKTQKFVWVK